MKKGLIAIWQFLDTYFIKPEPYWQGYIMGIGFGIGLGMALMMTLMAIIYTGYHHLPIKVLW